MHVLGHRRCKDSTNEEEDDCHSAAPHLVDRRAAPPEAQRNMPCLDRQVTRPGQVVSRTCRDMAPAEVCVEVVRSYTCSLSSQGSSFLQAV